MSTVFQPRLTILRALFLLLSGSVPAHAQLTNAALGKPVTASGPVFDAQRAATMINDGNASTFSHPAVIHFAGQMIKEDLEGEVHCGTSVKRSLPAYEWWTKLNP